MNEEKVGTHVKEEKGETPGKVEKEERGRAKIAEKVAKARMARVKRAGKRGESVRRKRDGKIGKVGTSDIVQPAKKRVVGQLTSLVYSPPYLIVRHTLCRKRTHSTTGETVERENGRSSKRRER